VRLTLDALTFTSPGEDPNGDGAWTDYTVRYAVVAEGAVPEPNATVVPALASLLLLRRRARRRNR
jgi:hypothetical protein